MVFDFIQFWLDGWPGNEHFWISHKISDTPDTPGGASVVFPENEIWNRLKQFLPFPFESQRNVLKSMFKNISYIEPMSEELGRFLGSARVNEYKKISPEQFYSKVWEIS